MYHFVVRRLLRFWLRLCRAGLLVSSFVVRCLLRLGFGSAAPGFVVR